MADGARHRRPAGAGGPVQVCGLHRWEGCMASFSVSDHPEVDRVVETCGYAAAALTILPIPGSEIIGVMPLHVGMVIAIAHHRGRTITRESATSLLLQIGTTVGLSLVGSR